MRVSGVLCSAFTVLPQHWLLLLGSSMELPLPSTSACTILRCKAGNVTAAMARISSRRARLLVLTAEPARARRRHADPRLADPDHLEGPLGGRRLLAPAPLPRGVLEEHAEELHALPLLAAGLQRVDRRAALLLVVVVVVRVPGRRPDVLLHEQPEVELADVEEPGEEAQQLLALPARLRQLGRQRAVVLLELLVLAGEVGPRRRRRRGGAALVAAAGRGARRGGHRRRERDVHAGAAAGLGGLRRGGLAATDAGQEALLAAPEVVVGELPPVRHHLPETLHGWSPSIVSI